MQEVALSALNIDGGTQPREVIDTRLAEEYALAMGTGAAFPPVVAFFDGSTYWLADGFHRHYAHKVLGRDTIECDVRQGTQRDAILFSVGANATHGLRRTNEDKRRAVTTLLKDPEWSGWSDREIARQCKVTHPFVSKLRPPVAVPSSGNVTRYDAPERPEANATPAPLSGGNLQMDAPRTVSRGGTTYTMKTAAIGARDVDRGKKEGALPFAPASPAGQPQAAARPPAPVGVMHRGGAANPPLVSRLERLGASPQRAQQFAHESEHRSIADAVQQVEREIDSLPRDAARAARLFPNGRRYTLPAQKLRYMADWLSAFADEWALIEQENRHVAAQ